MKFQIDEIVLARQNFQCGKIVKRVWLFGGLERKKAFVVPLSTECEEGER